MAPRGPPGANGANAGSIRIVVQRFGDLRLVARGGAGGEGGAGGNGGAGGKGGHIDVEFTAAGVPPAPLLIQAEERIGIQLRYFQIIVPRKPSSA